MRTSILVLLAATATASANPADAHYTVRVKRIENGTPSFVPVGEIDRTAGKVTWHAVAAPTLDKLTDDFTKAWKAYTWPATASVTEKIASDTGMHPEWKNYTFTFKPKDVLYPAAVIKGFLAKQQYKGLGLDSIRFIERDMTPESPPHAMDAASKTINIRKGTHLEGIERGGSDSIFVMAPVRPDGMGTPTGVLRVSQTDPNVAVEQDYDDGTITIAIMKIFGDGHVEVEPYLQGRQFESSFGGLDRDVDVDLIRNAKDYTHVTVPKSWPMQLEAYIMGVLEHSKFYDVQPAPDPAKVK